VSNIGTLTLKINATAVDAKRKLAAFAQDVQTRIKQIGNTKIADGSVLSKQFAANVVGKARQQFMAMVKDIEDVAAAAEKAGQSVAEFSGGMFTDADVKKAREVTDAFERLDQSIKGGRKDILINISQPVVDTVNALADIVSDAAKLAVNTQTASSKFGTAIGNLLVPTTTAPQTGRGKTSATTFAREAALASNPTVIAARLALEAISGRRSTDSNGDREAFYRDRERNELLRKIAAEKTPTQTVELSEAKLRQ